jgi:AcrR family transcriptional regulator
VASDPSARIRRLPGSSQTPDRDEVRRRQRERLQTAIAKLIARHGYHAVRVLDITKAARVSRPTFYSLYRDKEELLIAAYEEVAGRTAKSIIAAYNAEGSPAERLRSALREFAELAAAEPEAMSLLVLGAFGAGTNALERRNRMLETLEMSIVASRDRVPASSAASAAPAGGPGADGLTVKLILGGIRELTAARLRRGRAGELPALAAELTAWAASYPAKPPAGLERPAPQAEPGPGAPAGLASERARRAQGRLPSGRHDLPRDFIIKSQRERIVDATAAIVAERGLAGLTIPEIARRASVSHQTFYEMYPGKHEAYLGAQKVGLHQALLVTGEAYERHREDWPSAVAEGLRALIDYLASEPAHAHLTIVETFAASPEAIEVRDSALRAFAAYLSPGYEIARSELAVPAIAAEAIAGGIWQVLHFYVANERLAELPALVPLLTYMALTPFLGASEATEAARRPRPRAAASSGDLPAAPQPRDPSPAP